MDGAGGVGGVRSGGGHGVEDFLQHFPHPNSSEAKRQNKPPPPPWAQRDLRTLTFLLTPCWPSLSKCCFFHNVTGLAREE